MHEHERREWIDATKAFFVRAAGIPSLMGYGLAAFQERARAEAFARGHGGEVLNGERALREVQAPHRH